MQGKAVGWDDTEHIDENNIQYCQYCKKLYLNNDAFVGHLLGKKHIKLEEKGGEYNPEDEEKARVEFKQENENRKKNLAFQEFRIAKLREELASVIYDTMNLVRKKQTRGY